MQVNQKPYTTLLLSCLAISVFVLTGCRAGGFQKPNLSSLAFWKSENSMLASKDSPPPPARHFDPAPIDGDLSSGEIVELDNEKIKNRYNNDIDQMRAEIGEAAKALGDPIRKPYASETAELKSEPGSIYPLKSSQVKSKLTELDSSAKSGLNAAQNDFQSAMSNTTKSLSNDFSAAAASTGLKSGWKDDIGLPPGLSPTKSLADISQSIGDANGKLVSDVKSAANNSFNAKVTDLKNSFQPDLNLADKANDFLATAQNKVAEAVNPSVAAGSNLGQPKIQTNRELELAQAQIMEAKRQIEELKQQVALANRQPTTAPSTTAPVTTAPSTIGPVTTGSIAPIRTAQLQVPGFNSSFVDRIETEPANVLRSTNQPLRPQLSRPLQPQVNDSPDYSSTPHGGFSPRASANDFGGNFSPISATPASQVNFQTASDNPMVSTANEEPASPTGFAGELQNHVSEVDIPDSVLRGSGSYAPGSVQPLN